MQNLTDTYFVNLPLIDTYFEIPVDDKAVVHVLQPQYNLGRVEAHLLLREDPVLRQMVVQVATVH